MDCALENDRVVETIENDCDSPIRNSIATNSIPIKDTSPRSRKNSSVSTGSDANTPKDSYSGPPKGHCGKGHRFGDRKSRAATGRGLPKKLGGGGSFTWGRPGCELSQLNGKKEVSVDDADYDPLEDPNVVFDSVSFHPTEDEICLGLDRAIREYLANGQMDDLLDCCDGVAKKHLIVERMLEIGLEAKKEHRELISSGFRKLIELSKLNANQAGRGFSKTLDRAAELILDSPDIVNLLGKFIARAHLDAALPGEFIEMELEQAASNLVHNVMIASYALRKDAASTTKCWGETGGFMETRLLSEKIREILKEFLSTSDSGEVARCLRELDVPHFHHEIVYEAILIAMENYQNELVANSMIWLLQYLYTKECIISADQMIAGHVRIYTSIDDITLDIPHAYNIIQTIVAKSNHKKLISERLKLQCPNKTRKRFSSEGDMHDHVQTPLFADRTRLGSTGLCSTGLDSLPEIEDLRVEDE